MKRFFLLALLLINFSANGQFLDRVWCFGDSAGIDFNNLTSPQPFNTVCRARGSSVSICDSTGDLVLYASTMPLANNGDTLTVNIYNRYHQIIQNGDSIVGLGFYYELVLVPKPENSDIFYLFSIGILNSYGLYYTEIDMSANNGMGAVIQKNVQLLNYRCSDGLTAIKHGNGRDWWVSFRRGYLTTNDFYMYLVTPSGVQGPFFQSIGTNSNSNILRQILSPDGNKLLIINWAGLIELFDFDRCTGLASNPVLINPEMANYPYFASAEFSPSGKYLYITDEHLDTSRLYQMDLFTAGGQYVFDTIYSDGFPPTYAGVGHIKRGPDNKIYLANGYYNGTQNFFPYADSMYNYTNMYIGVINEPDSPGVACNFQPYSFYLGGKRSYIGLPNNPNYELGPIPGSPCDTLTLSASTLQTEQAEFHVFYHRDWQKAFINGSHLQGTTGRLVVTDMLGHLLADEPAQIEKGYYTRSLEMPKLAAGVYVVTLVTANGRLTGRFVVN